MDFLHASRLVQLSLVRDVWGFYYTSTEGRWQTAFTVNNEREVRT